ncbi:MULTISPECIES: GNAT family N-acetyltransferase [Paenibacillus]|uniref:GNAT family N-acetyltransferase n=1 Tax=Paenibacillus TaxID=44249 RepID=UPI001F4447E8|nr:MULTISPECIES: GNAT family N-acetyltransferase [Paenibacillus]
MNTDSRRMEEKSLFSIECKDVFLREWIPSDLDRFHSLTWQPEIYEFLPGWNVSKKQRQDWLTHYEIPENKKFLGAVSEGGNVGDLRLRLGIVWKESGELIGWCCTGMKEELPAPNREIVYAISKDHRGKGYAAQAVQGLVTYLFEETDVDVLNALALLRNIPSNRVLEKCGFRFQRDITIDGECYHWYTREKESRT